MPSSPSSQHLAADAPRLEIPIPGATLSSVTDPNDYSIPWVGEYIGGVYTFVISIIGLVAAVMMIIGGFQYLTSAGNAPKIGAAKKRITDAIIGLVLALGSYVLLFTINPDLVRFDALRIFNVKTEYLDEFDDTPDPDDDTSSSAEETSATDATYIESTGTTRVCDSAADCLPKCQEAGCTKVFCTKKEMAAGYADACINATRKNDCDITKFANISAHDIIPSNSKELLSASKWPKMKNIKFSSSVKATKLVVDGLGRADTYIEQNYPGQGYTIKINSCWRDYREEFNAQCATIARPTKNNPTEWYSTWPGGNPHSGGYACDLYLLKDGEVISGSKKTQTCKSTGEPDKLLVEILTNPVVGAKRLNYESWHFNWDGWSSCFCAMEECDKHLYPVTKGKRKCFDQVTPRSC